MARDMFAELANFTSSLEGWGLELQFDPDDPESVERAIREMETAIAAKADPYPGNEAVAQIVEQLKEQYRLGIREQRHENRGGA
jgi:FMN phosphatase YigB (HAD superfamily)